MSSSQPMSTDAERIIDVDVMTVSCCNPAYMSLLDWVHVHWSFHLLCNCRVGMTYVWIVPSFITHFQLLATTEHGIVDTVCCAEVDWLTVWLFNLQNFSF